MTNPSRNLRRQRGITLIGLLTWSILLGFAGYLLVRVIPTISEAYTVQGVVDRLAAAPPPTVGEIRRAFDRQKQVDSTIVSVNGSDLDITKENDKVVISFAYETEIPLFGPTFLLIKYAGRSR